MAGTILTPSAIWSDFRISQKVSAEIIEEKRKGDMLYSRLYVNGKTTEAGQVKIYGTLIRNIQFALSPAALIINDLDGKQSMPLAEMLAKSGYTVLAVDVSGKGANKDNYTIYPEDMSYANYENAEKNLYITQGDVKKTCWYEWVCSARYAFAYLCGEPFLTKVGGIGLGGASSVLWTVAGLEKELSCAVFTMDAGWHAYKDFFKFGKAADPQFSDDVLQYVAAFDPQSYAVHVKCPSILLSSLYGKNNDPDRAYDTLSRVKDKYYTAFDLSVSGRDRLDNAAFKTVKVFLDEVLNGINNEKLNLPEIPELKCELEDGVLNFECYTSKIKNASVENVSVYVAEEMINPSLRCWNKAKLVKAGENDYVFKYLPYLDSECVTYFARVHYSNGFTLSTGIFIKKFISKEVRFSRKSNIVYSGRTEGSENVFIAGADFNSNNRIFDENGDEIKIKNGPMGIEGIYSENGLATFKINAKKDKPIDGSLLMFDLYQKEEGGFTVKLISGYGGDFVVEYFATVHSNGGEFWYNFKLETSKFKTAEGRILRDLSKVNAIAFKGDKKYLINNVLWI